MVPQPNSILILSSSHGSVVQGQSPILFRTNIEKELDYLQETDIIEPVQFSDGAASVISVLKKDGSIQLCGDFKLTISQVAKLNKFPLPRTEDLFASLAGGRAFSKLNLAHAYEYIPLRDESRPYVTINTHWGLFQFNCLSFGVVVAPAIFQYTIETLLKGLHHISVYLDHRRRNQGGRGSLCLPTCQQFAWSILY